jgi:hypothetical protein
MPWTQVYVDDDGEIETTRRVLRPEDADDLEDAVEGGQLVPVQPVPQVIPNNAINGEVEIDDDGVEIDND